MKVSHIEHLGIAVNSLEEAIPYWENVLGLSGLRELVMDREAWRAALHGK